MSHEKRCDDSRASAKILTSFRFENESSTGTSPFFVAKHATTQSRKLASELYINGINGKVLLVLILKKQVHFQQILFHINVLWQRLDLKNLHSTY